MRLYFIETLNNPRRLKVGISADPVARLSTLQTGCAQPLRLIGSLPTKSELHARETERQWHQLLTPVKVRGEWFRFLPPVRALIDAALSQTPTRLEYQVNEWGQYVKRLQRKAWIRREAKRTGTNTSA